MKDSRIKNLIFLHIMLMIYSMSGIFSKLASNEEFLSVKFCLYYAGIIILLGFYAIAWQQVIKRLPLTVAFANKAITVVWGLIWGMTFFEEKISIGKCSGILLIIIGIVIFVKSEEVTEDE